MHSVGYEPMTSSSFLLLQEEEVPFEQFKILSNQGTKIINRNVDKYSSLYTRKNQISNKHT